MTRRDEPSLVRKLHLVYEAHANVLLQARCLAQRPYLGDLDFLAQSLGTLEKAAREARLAAEQSASREQREASV